MFKFLTFLTGSIFGAMVVVGLQGHAEDGRWSLIGAAGQCDYSRAGNGTWHQQQEGREVTGNTRPTCWQLGASYRFGGDWSKWSVEAVKVDGGSMTMSALAIGYPQDDASKHDPSINVQRPECFEKNTPDCLNRYRGSGRVMGLDVVVNRELFKVQGVSVSGGAGVYIYKAIWNAQVLPMDPACLGDDNNCKWREVVNQSTDWLVSPTLQLKAKYGPLFLSFKNHLRTAQHANITPGYADSHLMFLAGLEIPL